MESRRTFFFFSPEADKGGGKKIYSSSYQGNIEGLTPRRWWHVGGHWAGSIPERAGPCMPSPSGRTGRSFGYGCPFKLPIPGGRSSQPTLLGCWQLGPRPPPPAQPGRQEAPSRVVHAPHSSRCRLGAFSSPRAALGGPAALSSAGVKLVRVPEPARDAAGAASSTHGHRDRALGSLPAGF